MKGVIFNCMKELIVGKVGEEKWEQILEECNIDKDKRFLTVSDVDDALILKIINVTCRLLGLRLPEFADIFGDYWINVFAPRIYSPYYKNVKSAKELLLKVNFIHISLTRRLPNARPPKFSYKWRGENVLIMKYQSERGLIDFVVGCVKGVGNYFNENLQVTKLGKDRVKIVFLE